MADRVAVLVGGRSQQIGAPAEVYRRPSSVTVARLLGDPPMNVLDGVVSREGGAVQFRRAGFAVTLPPALRVRLETAGRPGPVRLGFRPANVRLRRRPLA